MSCQNAFYDFLCNCNDAIKVNALLEPAKPYIWVITDKFDREYTGEEISDGDGFLTIPVASLPDGFLTEFSGDFKLEIMVDDCQKIDFKLASFYDRIIFNVKGGPRVKNNLGCDFTCISTGGGGNSAVFPFTNVSTLDIPWTSLLEGLYGNAPVAQCYIQTSPGVYALTTVSIDMVGAPYALSNIHIDFGGNATGYILLN